VCFRMFVCDSELRLGYRPSSSEKEFLSAPIHSPPLWFAISVLHAPRAAHGTLTILCRAPRPRTAKGLVHQAPKPTFVVRLEARRTAKGVVHPAPWTNLCRAAFHSTHDKGWSQPCALTILCRATCHVAHDKEYHCSRVCSAAHGREGVTPSPRRRPSTPFLCRASHITHGKELCHALPFPKAHGKVLYRVKMHRAPFAMRSIKMRTTKVVPCVFLSLPCAAGARQSARIR
jgi:hypothetical protein